MGYIRKALEKGNLEHPGSACCIDNIFEIFVHFGQGLCCLLPLFVNRQLPCPHTNSLHGLTVVSPDAPQKPFGAQKSALWGV